MRIFNLFAVTILAIGFASTGAFADDTSLPPAHDHICNSDHKCDTGGNTPGGGSGCTVLCGTPETAIDIKGCSDNLAKLKRITSRDVLSIGEQRIHLMPLCDTVNNHSLTQAQLPFLQRGNVDGLRTSIESNPVLMGQLSEHGYGVKDVLGILLGSNAAVLYVHKL